MRIEGGGQSVWTKVLSKHFLFFDTSIILTGIISEFHVDIQCLKSFCNLEM